MGPPYPPVWKICLGQLSQNLQEAAELADILQEVSSHIQVTGLTRTLTARTSTSSGNPTKLSTKERIKRAVPLSIDAGNVPWSQLVAVVSSTAMQEHSGTDNQQPQVLEVNSGGAVYFLFFKLRPEQPQVSQPTYDQNQQQQQQQQQQPSSQQDIAVQRCQQRPLQDVQDCHKTGTNCTAQEHVPAQPVGLEHPARLDPSPHGMQLQPQQLQQQQRLSQQQQVGHDMPVQRLPPPVQLRKLQATAQEGVAVLKVGASRLAMQAEQFANELTRHLGIAAPDCRIVRQVGSTGQEWSSVLAAVQRLAQPPHALQAATAPVSSNNSSSSGPAAPTWPPAPSAAASSDGSGSGGCEVATELLSELQHLPCFLLMEFVEGSKLLDCPQAVDPAVGDVGLLCEDVGRLFLLDMLLGNADRMSCPELGWRGNPSNLLYTLAGSRLVGRAVAIDSCVARRPPALKASAEDAAVERLSQLLLAVPGVSMALLQQLLGPLREKQLQLQQRRQQSLPGAVGLCSQLSLDGLHVSSSGQAGMTVVHAPSSGGQAAAVTDSTDKQACATSMTAAAAPAAAAEGQFGKANGLLHAGPLQALPPRHSRACKTSLGGPRAQLELQEEAEGGSSRAKFTEEEVARFQAGLRQCLDGVLQIKGLLEMVSAKIAEWIAEFVDDVVRLNPALLPTQASPGPGAHLRSPKPSPRVSGRGSFSHIRLEPAALSLGGSASSSVTAGGADQAGSGAAGSPVLGLSGHQPGMRLSGGSFASRLHAAAVAGGEAGRAAGMTAVAARRALQSPQSPEPGVRPRRPLSPRPAAAAAAAPAAQAPEGSQGTTAPATSSAAAAAAVGGSGATDAGACVGAHNSSSASAAVSTPAKGLLQQLVGASKGGKGHQPLSNPFAAIKAAICSPRHSKSDSSTLKQEQHTGTTTSPAVKSPDPQPASSTAPAAAQSCTDCGSSTPVSKQQQCSTLCSPPHSCNGTWSGSGGTRTRSTSSDLAAAVAAALSPRANAAQAEALAGLFGGRTPSIRLRRSLHQVFNSSTSNEGAGGACVTPPLCARRATWCASDEPPAAAAAAAAGGGSGAATRAGSGCGGLIVTVGGSSILESTQGPKVPAAASPDTHTVPEGKAQPGNGSSNSNTLAHSNGGGSSSSSSTAPGAEAHAAHGSGASASTPGAATAAAAAAQATRHGMPPCLPTPSPSHTDSFLHRQHNTRHLSFTAGGGEAGSSNSSSPPGMAQQQQHQQQQQRSSSSSLQVLASLQLDATLATITQEARHDGALAERLAHWKARFREKGAELSAAIASWQQRHQLAAVLSTGFLDGSHPIVDAYELGVRLQHMLRRLTALSAGALVQVPIMVLPGVFLGNAVAADSHHLLQYLGVTHVLNAAQELQLTPDSGMFDVLRVAIRDEEEEEVTSHFYEAQAWMDAALSRGGAVLVHCHEGKSRSVTLLLAYLMTSRGLTLAAVLQHMRALHPKASPNAGFMTQLMRLDEQLYGSCSIKASELPRAKPEARMCSICGTAAGISYESLVRHTKAKHGLAKPPAKAVPAAAVVVPAAAAAQT